MNINEILNSRSMFKDKTVRSSYSVFLILILVCVVVYVVLTKGLNINMASSLCICVALFMIIFIAIGKITMNKIKKCPLVNAEVISCEKVEVRGDLYGDLQAKYYNVNYSFFYNNEQRTAHSISENKVKVGKKTKGYYDEKNSIFTDESDFKQFFISKAAYVIIIVLLIIAGIIIIYPMIEENTISRESLINDVAVPIICVIFILIGISFLKSAKKEMNSKKNSEKITATIVDFTRDFETDRDGSSNYFYRAIYEYFYNGKVKRYTSGHGSTRKPIVGNTVEIMVNNGVVIEKGDVSISFLIGLLLTFFPLIVLIILTLNKFNLN